MKAGCPIRYGLERRQKQGREIARDQLPPGLYRDNFKYVDTNNDGFWDEQEWIAFYNLATLKGHLLALQPTGTGDLTEKAPVWKAEKGLPAVPNALGVRRHRLHGSRRRHLDGRGRSQRNREQTSVSKQGRLEGALGVYCASPIAAGGRILPINQEGKAAVIRAGAQWELIAVNDLPEECWATPALSGNRLIVRTVRALYSFVEPKQ